ncbi:MAG: response regulator transcription factor [Phycisphaeraceae bacterium]|nr:response regulator transcription factor [Phycisphaeraceae bacterium]
MAKNRVLIVDDEEDIRELVELYLGRDGYDILACETGEQALEIVRTESIDLIVLDLMLPGISGLDVCKRLKANRKTESIPIVMLTAKGEDADVVSGLELGADDYVTKPFSGKVLAARVRRILKRIDADDQEMPVIEIDNLVIDPARRDVRFKGQSIKLTFTEFNVLLTLARRPGIVFSRYKIVDAIRGSDYLVTDRAVDVQIVSLRKKLKECGDRIETVRGVGYRFKD